MQTQAPWCPMWTEEQRKSFLSHVEEVVGPRFGEHTVDEQEGTVTIASMDCVMGLSNLAQTCRGADPEDWRLLVYNHISRLDDFAPQALADKLSDFDKVRDDLRVRVVAEQHTAHIDAVADPLPLGLYSCLSVDLGGAACPVDTEYFDKWGVDRDEVMALALANSLAADKLQAQDVSELAGNFKVFTSESLFGSANLFDFAGSVPDVGEMGAVVVVPAANTVLVCPVEPVDEFVDNSASTLAAGYIRYLSGPNSVSPNALWWRPDHPLEGFARLDHGSFELVVPEPLRSHAHMAAVAEQEASRPDIGLEL